MGKIELLILVGANVFIPSLISGMLKPTEETFEVFESVRLDDLSIFKSVQQDSVSAVIDPDMFKQSFVIPEYDGVQFEEKLKPKKMEIPPKKENISEESEFLTNEMRRFLEKFSLRKNSEEKNN